MSFLGERNAIALGVSQHAVLGSGPLQPQSPPSLLLQFAGAQTMDPRITFTRSTTATFTGQDGLIQTAAIDAPRFDYNPTTLAPLGLLIEESRTNLILQSEACNVSPWATAAPYSVSANAAISPDGTQNADALIVDSGQSSFSNNVTRQVVSKAASAIQYTRSGYFKALGATTSVRLQDIGNLAANSASTIVSLVNGSIVTAPSVTGGFTGASVAVSNAGNGWWRVAFTYTTDAHTSLTVRSFPYVGAAALTGNGTSGLLVYGVQLEVGAFATSYIPTVASQVTRAADVAVMTGTNFSSWYNATEGTLFAEGESVNAITGTTARRYAEINNGTTSNIISVEFRNTTQPRFNVLDSAVSQATITSGGTIDQFSKLAGAYAANNFAFSANGTLGTPDTSGTVPVVSQLNIGSRADNLAAATINGHIKKIVYYPRRLSNSELQGITS